MFPFVLCEIFACLLIHALVLPGIPYRSAHIVSLTAILPERPFIRVLNYSWMHLFSERKRFFCCLLVVFLFFLFTWYGLCPCCTLISGTTVNQFKLRRAKCVYSFCSAESHLTATRVKYGSMLTNTASFQLKLIDNWRRFVHILVCLSRCNVLPERRCCAFDWRVSFLIQYKAFNQHSRLLYAIWGIEIKISVLLLN